MHRRKSTRPQCVKIPFHFIPYLRTTLPRDIYPSVGQASQRSTKDLLTRSGNWGVQNGQPWAAPSSCDWGWTPAQGPSSWWTAFWRASWKHAATCPHGWLDVPARPLPRSLGRGRTRTCTAEHLTSPQGAAWACSLVDACFETRLADLCHWSSWEDASCTDSQVHFDGVITEIRDDGFKSDVRRRRQ